jgi:hypothetical protein
MAGAGVPSLLSVYLSRVSVVAGSQYGFFPAPISKPWPTQYCWISGRITSGNLNLSRVTVDQMIRLIGCGINDL